LKPKRFLLALTMAAYLQITTLIQPPLRKVFGALADKMSVATPQQQA
jgi:hypothetical protein